jgi:ribose 5-phosphate isomerase A
MVDDSKLVEKLGKFPVPVEVTPFAVEHTLRHLKGLPCDPVLRTAGGQLFITDNGNYIADCRFESITEPAWLDVKLKMIPGVVESGLFSAKIVTSIVVGNTRGEIREIVVNP